MIVNVLLPNAIDIYVLSLSYEEDINDATDAVTIECLIVEEGGETNVDFPKKPFNVEKKS